MPRICRCCDDVVYCIEMEDPLACIVTPRLPIVVRVMVIIGPPSVALCIAQQYRIPEPLSR